MKSSHDQENKKTSVFILTPTLDGGVGRIVTNIAKELALRGFDINLVVPNLEGNFADTIPTDIKVHSFSKKRISSCTMPLVKLLKNNKPDIILSLSFHANCIAVIARILSGVSKTKSIICEHINLSQAIETLNPAKKILMRVCIFLLYRFANSYVAVSLGSARSMSYFSGVNISKINVIYNPVIDEKFYSASRDVVSHPFFIDNGTPVLVTVGRLDYQKDLKTLLQAFSYLQKECKSRLIICGDGPLKSELESQAGELGISEQIAFLGFVKNPLPYMKQSDIFVLSSIFEGLPTVLIEALAIGTPIVSTDCPDGPKEILNNGQYGKLVPVGDYVAIANAIRDMLSNNTIPKAGEDYIKKFTTPIAVEEYIRLINSVKNG